MDVDGRHPTFSGKCCWQHRKYHQGNVQEKPRIILMSFWKAQLGPCLLTKNSTPVLPASFEKQGKLLEIHGKCLNNLPPPAPQDEQNAFSRLHSCISYVN